MTFAPIFEFAFSSVFASFFLGWLMPVAQKRKEELSRLEAKTKLGKANLSYNISHPEFSISCLRYKYFSHRVGSMELRNSILLGKRYVFGLKHNRHIT